MSAQSNQFEFSTNTGEKFYIGKRLGKGAFGEVQIAISQETRKKQAIKHEHLNIESGSGSDEDLKTQISTSQLKNEQEVQRRLQANTKKLQQADLGSANLSSNNTAVSSELPEQHAHPKIPDNQEAIFGWSGSECQLITNLQFKNLAELQDLCGGKFSSETICYIGLGLLDSLEQLHSTHFVHKDLKPENMMIPFNYSEDKGLQLIDFGLSCKYRTNNGSHVPFKNKYFMTGTARYSSINAMKGYEHARRDDLESLGYILWYLAVGKLPWQGLKIEGKRDRIMRTLMVKEKVPVEPKGAPSFISALIKEAREMSFEEDVSQERYKELIRKDLRDMGVATPTFDQDWLNVLGERNSMIDKFEDLSLQDMEKLEHLKKSFKVGINSDKFTNQCCNNKQDKMCRGCKIN